MTMIFSCECILCHSEAILSHAQVVDHCSKLCHLNDISISSEKAVRRLWFRQSVVGLSPRRHGFDPGSLLEGFVVDELASKEVLVPVLRVYPLSIIPQELHTHSFIYHRRHDVSASRQYDTHANHTQEIMHERKGIKKEAKRKESPMNPNRPS